MTMLELSGNMFYKIYFRVRELLAGHPECIHSHVFFESIESSIDWAMAGHLRNNLLLSVHICHQNDHQTC